MFVRLSSKTIERWYKKHRRPKLKLRKAEQNDKNNSVDNKDPNNQNEKVNIVNVVNHDSDKKQSHLNDDKFVAKHVDDTDSNNKQSPQIDDNNKQSLRMTWLINDTNRVLIQKALKSIHYPVVGDSSLEAEISELTLTDRNLSSTMSTSKSNAHSRVFSFCHLGFI